MAVDFDTLFNGFKDCKIGVIGDIMLDIYWWGHVDRISPEAPVPIVALDKKEYRVGGASNVALNLASLGVDVSVLSVMGTDENGAILKDLLYKNNIHTEWLVEQDSRITTSKTRIMSRNQQMMRLDSEVTTDLGEKDTKALLKKVEQYLAE